MHPVPVSVLDFFKSLGLFIGNTNFNGDLTIIREGVQRLEIIQILNRLQLRIETQAVFGEDGWPNVLEYIVQDLGLNNETAYTIAVTDVDLPRVGTASQSRNQDPSSAVYRSRSCLAIPCTQT